MAHSFKNTLQAFKNKKILYMFLLGISSGFPFAVTLGTLQFWMKETQIDLKTIGLFAFLRLPFSLKFLWSPLMDRFTPPFLDRRRGWTFVAQALLAMAIFAMGMTDPLSQIQQLLILTLIVNFTAASQDIVLDAYRREVLTNEELGLGIGVFVNGYITAFKWISGGLFILLPAYIGGWGNVYKLMGVFMGLMTLITLTAPKLSSKESLAPASLKEAFIGPLKDYFSRPEAYTVLGFIILYKIGDQLAGTLSIPYIIEKGFSKEEYFAIAKVWGVAATFLGGIVGGHYVLKLGIIRSLWVMGFLQSLSTVFFAFLELTGKNNWVLTGIIGFENLTAQMGTAAYAAYMASITNVRFTATQYALLSSLMAIPSAIFAGRTGAFAESLGWSQYFVACALVAAPGMFMITMIQNPIMSGWKNLLRKSIIGVTILSGVYALVASTSDIIKLFIKG